MDVNVQLRSRLVEEALLSLQAPPAAALLVTTVLIKPAPVAALLPLMRLVSVSVSVTVVAVTVQIDHYMA